MANSTITDRLTTAKSSFSRAVWIFLWVVVFVILFGISLRIGALITAPVARFFQLRGFLVLLVFAVGTVVGYIFLLVLAAASMTLSLISYSFWTFSRKYLHWTKLLRQKRMALIARLEGYRAQLKTTSTVTA
jgi:uncharacterized membrane protein YccF (DUF307 family)